MDTKKKGVQSHTIDTKSIRLRIINRNTKLPLNDKQRKGPQREMNLGRECA